MHSEFIFHFWIPEFTGIFLLAMFSGIFYRVGIIFNVWTTSEIPLVPLYMHFIIFNHSIYLTRFISPLTERNI